MKIKNKKGVTQYELDPITVTANATGRGKIKMLKQQLRDSRKEYRKINKELDSYDYIIDQNIADGLADRIINLSSPYAVKEKLKLAKDEYRSKNFLHIGDGTGNALPSQLYRYWSRNFGYQSKPKNVILTNKGTDIIDLSHDVIRVTPESNQSTALFNEFVETDNPSIYNASEYQDGIIKNIGDKYIPTKNINIFAGVENGKFKLDSLNKFDRDTKIYPARNIKKDTPLISGINITKSGKFDNYLNNETNKGLMLMLLNKMPTNDLTATKLAIMFPSSNVNLYTHLKNVMSEQDRTKMEEFNRENKNGIKMNYTDLIKFARNFNLNTNMYRNSGNKINILNDSKMKTYIFDKGDQSKYTYTDISGQEHPISEYNASILDNKMVLGNPNGGIFIGRIQDISNKQLDSLNSYLKKNPSWLVRPDLGSFDQYRLDNPSLKSYLKQYFEHPKEDDPNVYTVGTITPNKLWEDTYE